MQRLHAARIRRIDTSVLITATEYSRLRRQAF